MTRFCPAIATSVCVASSAAAHPGHAAGGEAWSLAHYLTEPIHAVSALLLLVAAWSAARVLRSRRAAVRRSR